MKRTEECLAEAHAMTNEPGLAHRDAVLMHRTKLRKTLACQPQRRNMHGRIFGSFFMRRMAVLIIAHRLDHGLHFRTFPRA